MGDPVTSQDPGAGKRGRATVNQRGFRETPEVCSPKLVPMRWTPRGLQRRYRDTVSGTTPKILVVDDEWAVLRLAQVMLTTGGYEVYVANSALEAIEVAERLQCGLNLLLTDMRMPNVDGHDLSLTIRRICPQIDTMVFTGYAPEDGRERNYPILKKPFTYSEMLYAVKQVLDAQL
jgi:two-component system cell cycle response regulator CpdR